MASCLRKATVMTGPPGEMAAAEMAAAEMAAAARRLRTSRADRDRVIGTLKSAFVQGMLTKDEFDARVGQTFASRTYAELAAVTADLGDIGSIGGSGSIGGTGSGPTGAPPPRQPAQPAEDEVADSSQNKIVNAGACAMLAVLVLNTAFFAGNFGVFLTIVAAITVALCVAGARVIYLRNEKRSRGRQQG